MKYYSLKYKDNIKDGFGGKASMWKIEILKKYRGDTGLLEHEKFHVRCWWYCLAVTWLVAAAMFLAGTDGWWISFLIAGPWVHSLLYRIRYFRKLVEVKAYKIQLKEGTYASPTFAVEALTSKYKLGISAARARKLLGL